MVLRAGFPARVTDITVRDLSAALLSLLALAAVTLVYTRWIDVTNATIVALTFLFIVLVTAATSRLRVAVITSIAAMLSLNFFFLPPVGTWTIADPQNWVALFVFLAVSLVASRLSHVARARTEEALGRRDELARLFDLSRDVLVMTATPDAVSHLARAIARRFDLE
jgi:two-component system sensor histidine kinase KdpD